jgi:hypothetical protein
VFITKVGNLREGRHRCIFAACLINPLRSQQDKKRANFMTNTAKKVVHETAKEAASTGAEAKATLKVVKPEAESKAPQKPKPTVQEVKTQIFDRFNLAEKHDQLSGQLADLKNFEANITNDARLRIENGSGRSFSSGDPSAVNRQIQFCRESIEAQIKELEALLYA